MVVVPTGADIPSELKAQKVSSTSSCSPAAATCVSVLTPWGTDEERTAAALVQRRMAEVAAIDLPKTQN
jgi:hypothetical protein